MAYTDIDDPSAYFQTKIYTGDGNNNRAITNDGNSDLQPDFIWLKDRNVGFGHRLTDSTRGITKNLASETTGAESTSTTQYASWNTDGFTLIYGGQQVPNYNGHTYVAWQWKANGGTTATNTTGSIDSVVQANTDAGMSIVTYTGTGGNITVGHGLGVAPNAIIIKSRSNAAPWVVWTSGMASGTTSVMELNTTGAEQTVSNYWYNGFSSTTFGLGTGSYSHNTNNYTYIAYCFAEKQGYSKFGKYFGNASADGPFVYTGFQPAFVMIKTISTADDWYIFDNKRAGFNPEVFRLRANTTGTETTGTNNTVDHLSNGFKLRFTGGSINGSGLPYIYMAFAENPFVTSTGIPTTAR